VRALLISTYDLGRQPFGLASPAAVLREAGHEVLCSDLTRTKLSEDAVRHADLVGFFLPMHTATRMALPVIDRVRALNPGARLAAYGLYAPLNAEMLRARGVTTILGPEFEDDLVSVAREAALKPSATGDEAAHAVTAAPLGRVRFITPDRSGLPPLTRYASLQVGTTRRTVGYTEASRGCKHLCRHCPIVPVYGGRFRAVPVDVVLADIRAQVGAGAEHVTFGDPDFLNGPTHAVRIVRALAAEFPGVSYDVTIKVEHLRRHEDLLPVLKETGCAFVTTAVESFEDPVLEQLRKGHTFADFEHVAGRMAVLGLPLAPTFVAFTPWTTIESYVRMLREIDRLGLVGAVAPIQYAIRLLVPEGSPMLELPDVRAVVERFDSRSLTHVWKHADPRVDALQQTIERLVGTRLPAARDDVFDRLWHVAHEAAGLPRHRTPLASRATIPYLNEPWYC
jgi:radical SAM superfamily enzyme YgiQ (UPF0313 family)